ncbi:hypothetical protein TcG_05499 [Trypanosoma cruzi]|nr:hypothetical protein TcG_05499 [Trypanosoma cruzi]
MSLAVRSDALGLVPSIPPDSVTIGALLRDIVRAEQPTTRHGQRGCVCVCVVWVAGKSIFGIFSPHSFFLVFFWRWRWEGGRNSCQRGECEGCRQSHQQQK